MIIQQSKERGPVSSVTKKAEQRTTSLHRLGTQSMWVSQLGRKEKIKMLHSLSKLVLSKMRRKTRELYQSLNCL